MPQYVFPDQINQARSFHMARSGVKLHSLTVVFHLTVNPSIAFDSKTGTEKKSGDWSFCGRKWWSLWPDGERWVWISGAKRHPVSNIYQGDEGSNFRAYRWFRRDGHRFDSENLRVMVWKRLQQCRQRTQRSQRLCFQLPEHSPLPKRRNNHKRMRRERVKPPKRPIHQSHAPIRWNPMPQKISQ